MKIVQTGISDKTKIYKGKENKMDYLYVISRIEHEDVIVLQVMCRDGVHTCYHSIVN